MRINYLFSKLMAKLASFTICLSLIVSLIPLLPVHAAAGDKLFFNPNALSMNINTIFDVNVRSYVESEIGTITVSGTVTYPTDRLQVVSVTTGGSSYGAPSISQGTGTITFSGSRSANTGNHIFSIKFKAIGSGSATVGFAENSKINNSATERIPGTYTITNPNPPASSTPPPPKPPTTPTTPKPSTAPVVTTPPTDTPVPSTGPVVTPDPTGLIDTVTITSLYSSAKVTWKVNAPNSTSTFTYGFTTSQLDKKVTPTKKADGSFEAAVQNLVPGTRYIFYVTATGADGKSGNYTSTIFTRGYPVTIKVTENGKPVTKGQIRIGTTSSQITSNSVATIGLAAGSYTGTITTDTASLAISLTVESKDIPSDGSAPESQTFSFGLTSSILEQGPGSGESILTFVIVLIVGSILLAMAFVGLMAYRRKKFESDSDGFATYRNPGQSVVIDDGYTWHEPDSTGVIPSTPYTTPGQTPVEPAVPLHAHNNSVYLNEAEPLDMFDQAAQKQSPLQAEKPTQNAPSATGQNPNLPHSTTP